MQVNMVIVLTVVSQELLVTAQETVERTIAWKNYAGNKPAMPAMIWRRQGRMRLSTCSNSDGGCDFGDGGWESRGSRRNVEGLFILPHDCQQAEDLPLVICRGHSFRRSYSAFGSQTGVIGTLAMAFRAKGTASLNEVTTASTWFSPR